jgi:hypothetical protein
MKKTFKLQQEGRHPDRVLDAVKHEIRQYVRREGRKSRPAGVDYWDFDCKVGDSKENAAVVHLSALVSGIDQVAQSQAAQVYVEVLATHGKRQPRPVVADAPTELDIEAEDDLPE